MSRYENPPFPLGTTFFGGDTTLIETANSAYLEGMEWEFEDADPTVYQGLATMRTNAVKRCRVVRNKSGGALLAKRVARCKSDGTLANQFVGQVSGYADTVGQKCYPIDEGLPSAGVADNDLFWVVIRGPAKVTTAGAGDTNISIGSFVIPSTSGTVIDQDTTVAAGAATFNQIQGAIGRALEAVNAISTDFTIFVTG